MPHGHAHGHPYGGAPVLLAPEAIAGWTEIWGPRLGGSTWAYQDQARTSLVASKFDPIGSITGVLNGKHLEQSVGGLRPQYVTGAESWQGNGATWYLRTAIDAIFNSIDSGGWAAYVMMISKTTVAGERICAWTASDVLNDYGDQNASNIAWTSATQLRSEHEFPGQPNCVINGAPTTNAYGLWTIEQNNGTRSLYGANTVDTQGAAVRASFNPDRVFSLAGTSGGITFMSDCRIYEMGVINRRLTAAEKVGLVAWLQSRGYG